MREVYYVLAQLNTAALGLRGFCLSRFAIFFIMGSVYTLLMLIRNLFITAIKCSPTSTYIAKFHNETELRSVGARFQTDES